MKKTFFLLIPFFVAVACSKSDIQQTTSTIKSADSIFNKAKDGFKTLDSISKIVNDSTKVRDILKNPEIQKEKERIEKQIRNGDISLDSISKTIDRMKKGDLSIDSISRKLEKLNKTINTGTDVVKTMDSANKAIEKGANPIVVLTETASKILKKRQNEIPHPSAPKSAEQHSKENSDNSSYGNYYKNPISKTGSLDISVPDLSSAKYKVKEIVRMNNGEIVTESYANENNQKEIVTAKVPLKNFENAVSSLSGLGEISAKAIQSEGIDYEPNQMCDIEIRLNSNENQPVASNSITEAEQKPDTFGEKSTSAFKKGFSGFKDLLIVLIPFWPLFLIGGLVWYFVERNKKRKREEDFQRQLILEKQKQQNPVKENQEISEEELKNTHSVEQQNQQENLDNNPNEPDYSKYMPKS